jgi:hypothetical protein
LFSAAAKPLFVLAQTVVDGDRGERRGPWRR